jgi:hypothetical protein
MNPVLLTQDDGIIASVFLQVTKIWICMREATEREGGLIRMPYAGAAAALAEAPNQPAR